nr:cadherin repeat domain-containing protein [Lysinibacillus timonensis]
MNGKRFLLMFAICCSFISSFLLLEVKVEAEEIRLEPSRIKAIEYGTEEGEPFNQYCNRDMSTNPYCDPHGRVDIALGYDEYLDYSGIGVVEFDLKDLEGKNIIKAYLSTYVTSAVFTRHTIHIKGISDDDSWRENDTEIPEDYFRELPLTGLEWNKINTFPVTDFIKAELAGDKKVSFVLDATDDLPDGDGYFNENIDIRGWGDTENPDRNLYLFIELASTPTDISLTNTEVEEKEPIGTTVGTLSATDPDADDTFSYEIMDGDTDAFAIVGDTLVTNAEFDYSVKDRYEVTIRVTDSTGNTFDKSFTIQVKQNVPPTGSLTINGGAEFTNSSNVTLDIVATDSNDNPIEMRLKDGTGDWGEWEPYINTKPWTFSDGDGLKTIELQLRDSKSMQPDTYSDSITLDTTPPTGSILINDGVLYTNNTNVILSLSTTDANDSLEMQLSNDGVDWNQWEPFNPSKTWTLVSGDGEKKVYMQLRDLAGNLSESYEDSIIIDTTPPTVIGVIEGNIYKEAVEIIFNDGTATLNGVSFVSGTTVTNDGNHKLIVTDMAGNTTTVNFSIDSTPPTGSLIINNGATHTKNAEVTLGISASDANGPIEMRFSDDGVTWSEWKPVSATENWNLSGGDGLKSVYMELKDRVGNITSDEIKGSITLDSTPPTIAGIADGATVNTNVTITFDEGTATLNEDEFTSGTTLEAEGTYTLEVTDAAGNITTITFTIDKTPPVVIGVENGRSYNSSVTITFNDGTATLNDSPFTSGTNVSDESIYKLVVTDAVGNTTTVEFTIDKTAPVVTGVHAGAYYNKAVTITFNEGTATLNDNPFTSGSTMEVDGDYTLEVSDAAGNTTTIDFTIDQTPPVVTGVENGKSYNTDVTISSNEGTAILNGNPFNLGNTVNVEDDYTLVVTDAVGNTTTVEFTIDKTAPVVTGVDAGAYYNEAVIITFDEGTAMLNGTAFTSGSTVEADDSYTLVVTDEARNQATVTFTIDTILPQITGVENGKFYNADVTITFNEGTATLNGTAFTSGSTVQTDSSYTLVVTDEAGNITTLSFTIDKIPPKVSGVEDGSSYNKDVTITFDEGTATLNESPFVSGSMVGIDNIYTLIVTDDAGNQTTATFTIDKTPPQVTGVEDGKSYNTGVTISSNEGTATLNGSVFILGSTVDTEGIYSLIVTDAVGNTTTVGFTIDQTAPVVKGVEDAKNYNQAITITFDEGTATLNGTAFTSGSTVQEEGSYELAVTDEAGNTTTITFTIDQIPPQITGVEHNKYYNTAVTITFDEGTATLNGTEFTSGSTVEEDSIYTLLVTDEAGNTTIITFTIDQIPPQITGVELNKYYNKAVTITFDEGTATLNGNVFTSGSTVQDEGSYELVVMDEASNTTTVTFTIDKTPPVVTGVVDDEFYNTDVTISFDEGTATLNGNAFTSGITVQEEGSYELVVTDEAGNTTTVTFTIDKTLPVVTGVVDDEFYNTDVTISFDEGIATLNGSAFNSGSTVQEEGSYELAVTDEAGNTTTIAFIIDKTQPQVTGVTNGEYYNTDVTITYNEGTATLDGAPFTSGSTVDANGSHTLVVTDLAGNQTTIQFTIDTISPSVAFNPNGSNDAKEKHTTKLSVSDDGSGVATTKYQWTATKDFPTTGEWLVMAESNEVSHEKVRGLYYLHILAEDKLGNQTKITSEPFRFNYSRDSGGSGGNSKPTTPPIEVPGPAPQNIVIDIVNGKVILKPKTSNIGLVLHQSEQKGNILFICYGTSNQSTNQLLEIQANSDVKSVIVIYDDQLYSYLPTQMETPATKEWNITFTQALDVNSINEENVFVTDQQGNKVEFEVQISDDGKSIKLIPKNAYNQGEMYLLNVLKDVRAKSGQKLNMPVRMIFTIE